MRLQKTGHVDEQKQIGWKQPTKRNTRVERITQAKQTTRPIKNSDRTRRLRRFWRGGGWAVGVASKRMRALRRKADRDRACQLVTAKPRQPTSTNHRVVRACWDVVRACFAPADPPGSDISALTAALGSGLPGLFALRLRGPGPFEIPGFVLLPFQEVRVIATDVGTVRVQQNAVQSNQGRSITLGANATLVFSGAVAALEVQCLVELAAGSTLAFTNDIGLAPGTLGQLLSKSGDGALRFDGALTVLSLSEATCGTASGALPGAVTLELTAPLADGGATGTHTFDGQDFDSFANELKMVTGVWDSGDQTDQDGQTFTLFKLPPHHPAFPDNPQGGQQYAAVCHAYGLRPIGCNEATGYRHDWDSTMVGMPESWGCNIADNGQMHSDTGWSSVAFYQYDGNGVEGIGSNGNYDRGPDDGSSPVCALPH
eukprot:SAG31_NODE_7413_length_1696_cov_1.177207_1_plen_428_part_00